MGPGQLRLGAHVRRTLGGIVAACVVASVSLLGDGAGGLDPSCASFPSQAKAQEYFLANGGPTVDTYAFDGDNDGIACDGSPAPYAGILSLSHDGQAFAGSYLPGAPSCLVGRVVTVSKLRKGKPPKVIGKDTLEGDGVYSVPSADSRGKFIAKIPKTATCAAESSPKFVASSRRLEISPAEGLNFVDVGEVKHVEATFVDDETDTRTPATNAWFRSSDPDEFTVGRDGSVTANVQDGSAQIIAAAEGISSAPILAVAFSLPADAIRLTDAQIDSTPTTTGGDPTWDAPFTAILHKLDSPPEEGQLYVSTEEIGLVGRVRRLNDLGDGRFDVEFTQVSLNEAFPNLTIDESFDMGTGPVSVDPDAAASHSRRGSTHTFAQRRASGIFGDDAPCELEAGQASLVKFESPPKLQYQFNPHFDVAADGGKLQRMVFSADPVVKVDGGFTIQGAFEFSIECEIDIFEHRVPFGPGVGFVIGAQFPLKAVITAGGKLTLASVTIRAETTVKAHAAMGVVCPPTGECNLLNEVSADKPVSKVEVTKQSILDDGPRFEPELTGVLRLSPSIGLHHVEEARLVLADADLGAKLAGKFGTMKDQVNDTNFASEYVSETVASVTIGPQLSDVAKKLNLEGIVGNSFEAPPIELAHSPTGVSLKTDNTAFKKGEKVNFKLKIDNTKFFGAYNVQKVLLVRRVPGTTDQVAVVSEERAFPGQKDFLLTWVAESRGMFWEHEFWAFAVTEIIPFDDFALELAKAEPIFTCDVRRNGDPDDYEAQC